MKNFQQKVIDEIVSKSEVEYPLIMEEEELDNMIRSEMRRWQMDEKGMEEYLKSIKKTPEQFRDDMRPSAIRSLKQSLVLTEVAQQEKINVDESDIKNEIESMTKGIPDEKKGQLVQLLNIPQYQVNMASSIVTRKVIDKLTEIAQSPAETENKTENTETAQAEEQKEA